MADRPPASSSPSYTGQSDYTHIDPYADPFADRPRQTQFSEPERPYHAGSTPHPYDSTASLPDFGVRGGADGYDDETLEKEPLNAGNFAGGFYPPKYVLRFLSALFEILTIITSVSILALLATPMPAHRPSCRRPRMVSTVHGAAAKPSSAV